MRPSILVLLTAVVLCIQFGHAQDNPRPLQPLEQLSLIGNTSIPMDARDDKDGWLDERIRSMFSGQVSESFDPQLASERSLFVLETESTSTAPLTNSQPPLDVVPATAKRLQPLAPQTNFDSTSIDESHVVLASGTIENPDSQAQEEPDQTNPDSAGSESASAGEGSPVSSDISNESSGLLKEIAKLKKTVGADDQIDLPKTNERLERLTTAESSLTKAATYRLKKEQYDRQLEDFADLEKLSEVPADDLQPEPRSFEPGISADSLLPDLQSLKQKLQEKEDEFNDLENNLETLNSRITEIPSIRAATTEEFDKTEKALSLLSDQDEDLDGRIRWLVQRAKQIALETKLDMLDSETRRQELAGKFFPAKRDQASRQIKRFEARIKALEKEIEKLRRDEVKQQAEQAYLEAINAHPALKDLANRNQELTQARKNINEKIQVITKEDVDVKGLVDDLVENKRTLEGKIEAFGGVTQANGMLLVESRRSLVSPFESMARIRAIQTEQKIVNVAVLTLEEERKPLADPNEFIKQQMTEEGNPKFKRKQLEATAVRFAQTKREYLDDLLNDYNRYRGLLQTLEVHRKELIGQIAENRKYIDEKALWVRNTEPISMQDVSKSIAGVRAFFNPADWTALGHDLVNRVASKPHEMALGACGLMVIVIMSRRLTKK